MTQVYKCLNDLAPAKLSVQITHLNNTGNNSITTRLKDKGDLLIPNIKLENARKSFRYRGPQLFDMLFVTTRNQPTLASFKHKLMSSDMFEVI